MHDQATLAPMLKKDDGRIDWHQPAKVISDRIRGMNPWPGTFTFYDDKRLKIFKAAALPAAGKAVTPGTVVTGFPDELRVATGNGLLSVLEIQGESGNLLRISEYLRGHPIPAGTKFD
jgi:methionyl-tRNA formyltransferase